MARQAQLNFRPTPVAEAVPSTGRSFVFPAEQTRCGPSDSGERSSRSKRSEKPASPVGPGKKSRNPFLKGGSIGVFKDGHDYWQHRTDNFNKISLDESIYTSLFRFDSPTESGKEPSRPEPLFRGMRFYMNPGTLCDVSNYHLGKLIVLHGGSVQPFFNKKVSHVLCTNLSGGKEQEMAKRFGFAGQARYMHPNFVLESARARKLQPEFPYLIRPGSRSATLPVVRSDPVTRGHPPPEEERAMAEYEIIEDSDPSPCDKSADSACNVEQPQASDDASSERPLFSDSDSGADA
eukprot:TRINITY_DN16127_c0_g2_i1.p1 TRINITY_DN16127_c0_g2~~TRINITY_DN16127_c0_g2_i1.p1  ORF type:complete len:300 (+),score=36.78 TRINITY_DN16127_c0_g2_i1:26-901(+)